MKMHASNNGNVRLVQISSAASQRRRNSASNANERHFLFDPQHCIDGNNNHELTTSTVHVSSSSNNNNNNNSSSSIPNILTSATWDNALYTTPALKNKHSKCEDLIPENRSAMKHVYRMDYCIFQYDDLPQQSCPPALQA